MVGDDNSLLGGIVAAATLILINVILTKVLFRDTKLNRFITGEPRLLVRNGQFVMSNLLKESIREEELEEQICEAWIFGHLRSAIGYSRNRWFHLDSSIR